LERALYSFKQFPSWRGITINATKLPEYREEGNYLNISHSKYRCIFSIKPAPSPKTEDPKEAVFKSLTNPIGSLPLHDLVKSGDKVLVIADDHTRPTPQQLVIPPLLDYLNKAGVPDRDYWQGLKPESLAAMAVRPGGIIIIYGRFLEGVSSINNELDSYGKLNKAQIDSIVREGIVTDGASAGALYQHCAVRERATIMCVSDGISKEQAESLGLIKIASIDEALEAALKIKEGDAEIGIIEEGGEVVPYLSIVPEEDA